MNCLNWCIFASAQCECVVYAVIDMILYHQGLAASLMFASNLLKGMMMFSQTSKFIPKQWNLQGVFILWKKGILGGQWGVCLTFWRYCKQTSNVLNC